MSGNWKLREWAVEQAMKINFEPIKGGEVDEHIGEIIEAAKKLEVFVEELIDPTIRGRWDA